MVSSKRIIVADTGPLRYFFLIGHINLLPDLFGKVYIPVDVHTELLNPSAPKAVREWAASKPDWLIIMPTPQDISSTVHLDKGERTAINLALSQHAELILMDDRAGVIAARNLGLAVIGTLGLIDLAARRGMVDLENAIDKLKKTNFRYRQELIDQLFPSLGKKLF